MHVCIDTNLKWKRVHIYYYHSLMKESDCIQLDKHGSSDHKTQSVEFDLMIRDCQRDMIRLYRLNYCRNDKFTPSRTFKFMLKNLKKVFQTLMGI
jgi:hypothetical protein